MSIERVSYNFVARKICCICYKGLDIKDLNKKHFYDILYVRKSYNLFMKGVCLWICRS